MKKKTIAVIGAFAAGIAMFLIFMTAEAKAQLPDQVLSVGNLAGYLKTPQDVALYIWRYFDFEHDRSQFGKEEYWQTAEEILRNRKGDCEDFALFAHEIMKQNGISSFVISLYGSKPHAICIFKKNGLYGAVNGGDYIAPEFKDLCSLLSYIDPFWNKAAITEIDENHRGRVLTELSNCRKKQSKKFLIF